MNVKKHVLDQLSRSMKANNTLLFLEVEQGCGRHVKDVHAAINPRIKKRQLVGY